MMEQKMRAIIKAIDFIRTKNSKKEHRLENIADYPFLSSPTGILVIILLLNEEIRP
jgi:hypothetical protein